MLNKKMVFNFVYAIGLIGLITTCVGFLSEVIGFIQLFGLDGVQNLWRNRWRDHTIFYFYLAVFIISAFVAVIAILKRFGTLKWKKANLLCIIGCVIMLGLSIALIYVFDDSNLNYSYYTFYYALRTGVISFVTYFGIVLGCDIIEKRHNKKKDTQQNQEEQNSEDE